MAMTAIGQAFFDNVWYDIVTEQSTGIHGHSINYLDSTGNGNNWFKWSHVALVLKGSNLTHSSDNASRSLVIKTAGSDSPVRDTDGFDDIAIGISTTDLEFSPNSPSTGQVKFHLTNTVAMGPDATGFEGEIETAELWVKCHSQPNIGGSANGSSGWWTTKAANDATNGNQAGGFLAGLTEASIPSAQNGNSGYKYHEWNKFAELSEAGGSDGFEWSRDGDVPDSTNVLDSNDRVKNLSFIISIDPEASGWMDRSPYSSPNNADGQTTSANNTPVYREHIPTTNEWSTTSTVISTERNQALASIIKDGNHMGREDLFAPTHATLWSIVQPGGSWGGSIGFQQLAGNMSNMKYGPGFAFINVGQIIQGPYDGADTQIEGSLPTTTAGASDSDVYWNFYRTTLGFGASAVSNPEKQITQENSTKIPNTGNVATIQAGDGITLVFPFGNRNRVEA